jgi:hypothetical protein
VLARRLTRRVVVSDIQPGTQKNGQRVERLVNARRLVDVVVVADVAPRTVVMFLMRPREFFLDWLAVRAQSLHSLARVHMQGEEFVSIPRDWTPAEVTSAGRSHVFRVSRAEACIRVLFGELVLDLVVCCFCRIHLARSLVLFSVARTMCQSQGRVRQSRPALGTAITCDKHAARRK